MIVLSQHDTILHMKRLTLAGVDIPEQDVELLRKELPKVEVKWTKPDEGYLKRIRAVYGPNG